MKRFSVLLAIVASLLIAGSVMAAPAKAQRLLCFSGGAATCTTDGGNNTAYIVVPADGQSYAGVYTNGKSYSGKPLSAVDFSFTYAGTVGGGYPRLSIPIDSTGDGKTDGYAFIDAANCGYTSDSGIHTVSTNLANCQVFYGSASYANWDAFAAANPTYTIGTGRLAFVVVDGPGTVSIYDAYFGPAV